MATYVLVPGAASDPWHRHLLADQLHGRGHEVLSVDLPCDDDSAGLGDYADTVVDTIGTRADVVLVAHSFAGFSAPLVAHRRPVDLLVMLNAMVPAPGETPAEWWTSTGHATTTDTEPGRDRADGPTDDEVDDPADEAGDDFFHDVPAALAAEATARLRGQSSTPFEDPWPLSAWPAVETRWLICRADRMFPAAFQRQVLRNRLAVEPDEMDGSHFVALSRPRELADRLEDYRAGI